MAVHDVGRLFEHLGTVSLSHKQNNKFLSKEGAMKRFIMLAMVLVMMVVSIGGCWIGWEGDDRGGRGGGHDRGERVEDTTGVEDMKTDIRKEDRTER